MAISKIILNGVTQIDLTQDSVSANNLIAPNTAHGADGEPVVGTATTGPDMPVFTVTWDSSFETISSVSCDKTYNDCVNLTSDGTASAIVAMADPNQEVVGYAYASVSVYGSNYFLYTVLYGLGLGFDIQYNSNGTIQVIQPSTRSQTLNITENGTYYPEAQMIIDEVNVSVSSSSPSLQAKTNISPTTSSQTITADSGYDGLSSVQINAMPTGTAGTPTATKGTVSNHSVTVTPSVTNTTGYITGGTKSGTAVTVSASELVSGSETKTENGTYDVTNLASLVVNVPTGGGSTKNVQYYMGADYVQASSYTATDVTVTVAKTGTYKVSWMAWRSTSSGTSGSQLYINGTAYGSANTTFTGTYGQAITLTGVSLTQGDVLVVRARSRNTSYYMYVGNLIIEEQ